MANQDAVLGEEYPHKVTAEYDNQSEADRAVKALADQAGVPPAQVRLVKPHGSDEMARQVEPESRGVRQSLIKSHVRLGLAGLILGVALAGVLVVFGPTATQSSPLMTFIALGFLCTVLALLLAGAISMRPDHDRVLHKTRAATEAGQWTVVVHCADAEQRDRVKDTIDHSAQTL
ncbi:magnesium transporter [Halomonas piscis]|uniref:magnesium transporter n=1 Tax=Halomonas piscis TaxID=3031727 RepID=UPI00289B2DC9|nr:magnesium transporter [Halomonas piscis]